MNNESMPSESKDVTLYYVIGAIVLVVIAIAVFVMRPKSAPTTSTQAPAVPEAVTTPKTGPITGLSCEKLYYNPVIGFPKYYFSVEGVDVAGTSKVDCALSLSVAGKTVGKRDVASPTTSIPERNGSTFRCSTDAVELAPGVATVLDVTLTNDKKTTATCTQTFLLPRP